MAVVEAALEEETDGAVGELAATGLAMTLKQISLVSFNKIREVLIYKSNMQYGLI